MAEFKDVEILKARLRKWGQGYDKYADALWNGEYRSITLLANATVDKLKSVCCQMQPITTEIADIIILAKDADKDIDTPVFTNFQLLWTTFSVVNALLIASSITALVTPPANVDHNFTWGMLWGLTVAFNVMALCVTLVWFGKILQVHSEANVKTFVYYCPSFLPQHENSCMYQYPAYLTLIGTVLFLGAIDYTMFVIYGVTAFVVLMCVIGVLMLFVYLTSVHLHPIGGVDISKEIKSALVRMQPNANACMQLGAAQKAQPQLVQVIYSYMGHSPPCGSSAT